MTFFTSTDAVLRILGPSGELEVMVSPVKEGIEEKSIIAIICHPHPLQGGTLNNKVVTILARTFADLGIRTVRFNFRGVGASVGVFADGIGEREDLLAVIAWVKKNAPHYAIWLSGFSFGAAVSAQVAARNPVARLVSIAPPVPRFDLLNLPPITCPWLVVQGDKDDVVEPAAVAAWVETRKPRPDFIRMPDAGHFFHGQLMELRRLLTVALQ